MTTQESTIQPLSWGYAGSEMFQTGSQVPPLINNASSREQTNLILNYLPQDMGESEVRRLFSKFGEIRKAKIIRHRSGISCCYGFVDYVSTRQAAAAQAAMDGYETRGKRLKVAFARPSEDQPRNSNLYVANLPTYMDDKKVRELFATYGNVLDVNLLRHKFNRISRGVAFVHFENWRDAEMAKYGMDRYMIEGAFRPLTVKFVERPSKGPPTARGGNLTSSGLQFKLQGNDSPPISKRRQEKDDEPESKRSRDSD
ncbi:ELAV-like protein 1 [Drosophila teissieri]|uniref:ELAV-like protein 1 n=1 Tax=Drosophila teissieri TaxID=7243 RepID=UPI001CB9D866|nr:ELAV-like protein 1 [Drosophila teissieri]